jgi:hypothetical protein
MARCAEIWRRTASMRSQPERNQEPDGTDERELKEDCLGHAPHDGELGSRRTHLCCNVGPQFAGRNAGDFRDLGKAGDIRLAHAGFPAGDGFARHVEQIAKLILRQRRRLLFTESTERMRHAPNVTLSVTVRQEGL